MVHPPPPHLLPEQRERLEQLVGASRLRAALYPSPKPPPVQRRSRDFKPRKDRSRQVRWWASTPSSNAPQKNDHILGACMPYA
jgi:hypothetical protein